MKYVLVLQFDAEPDGDDIELWDLEERLSDFVEKHGAELDGNDVGEKEMNIFIFTDEPEALFQKMKPLLKLHLNAMRVAYRDQKGDKYTVLHPAHLKQFKLG